MDESWIAISGLINGLRQAGELYVRFMSNKSDDSYGAGSYLRNQCEVAVKALREFRREFEHALPESAVIRIDYFLGTSLAQATFDQSADHRAARGAMVGLVAVEAEVTFMLHGRQEQIRTRSERALLLLQRTLAVDEEARGKWKAALGRGEVSCERLGSVALLSQGIYAFKVDATGARTDLVFSEPPDNQQLFRTVEGLVLTEWKVADAGNAAARFAEARKQADLYSAGPLAGIELTGYRYLVVVSAKSLPHGDIPGDQITPDGVTYRHVNLVVEPEVPSKASKR